MTMELTLACGDYDRTPALRTGDVRPEGIDVNYLTIPPAETFVRMEAYAEFQASEMSLSAYIIGLSKGDDRFVGIPAFPSRVFRHRTSKGQRRAGDPFRSGGPMSATIVPRGEAVGSWSS